MSNFKKMSRQKIIASICGIICVLVLISSGSLVLNLCFPTIAHDRDSNSSSVSRPDRRISIYVKKLTQFSSEITAPLPSSSGPRMAPAPAPLPINVSKLDCVRNCGKVSIPYPFGLSPECALSSHYELSCNYSNSILRQEQLQDPDGPWPFISTPSGSFQVTSIGSNDLIINATKIKSMPSPHLNCSDIANASLMLDLDSPFIISSVNTFVVIGCKSLGLFTLNSTHLANLTLEMVSDIGGMCGPVSCFQESQSTPDFCNLYDCCYLSITSSKQILIYSDIYGRMDHNIGVPTQGCGFASLLYPPSYSTWDNSLIGVGQYGVQLLWAVQNHHTCAEAKRQPDYACAPSPANCVDMTDLQGYVCNCSEPGYYGDGYISSTGCHDIDECANSSWNNCSKNSKCTNFPGSYTCSCEGGLKGDGYRNGTDCTSPRNASQLALIGGIIGGVASFLVISVIVVKYSWRSTRHKGLSIFDENIQSIDTSFCEIFMEIQKKKGNRVCKIFTLEELKLATNNFSLDNKIGKGGFGIVFKGVFADGSEIAIKKPKNNIGGHIDDKRQFINEIIILSQVNHRNLVRLIGCCLDTNVPLLVYEYISNGTLLEHLQAQRKTDKKLVLDWNQRLNIAIGTSEALTYLHFGISPPILHRDIKTSNILLDDKYCAKVADFGLSRFVSTEETHVSTILQGTPGYMDPEFLENMQVSDKSDVYSFGVVLLELITAQKPIDLSRKLGEQNLVSYCIQFLAEARLEDLFDEALITSNDPQMLQNINDVVKVALKCVRRSRQRRPTIKEVLDELLLIKNNFKGFSRTLDQAFDQEQIPLKSKTHESAEEYEPICSYASFLKSTDLSYKGSSKGSFGLKTSLYLE